MNADLLIIMVACGSKKEAAKIAAFLLKKRLAACVNIISGVDSRFWWKGRVDRAAESLMMIKTARKKFQAVERAVKSLHSYEVPEIIAIPVIAGSREYIKWAALSLKICRDS